MTTSRPIPAAFDDVDLADAGQVVAASVLAFGHRLSLSCSFSGPGGMVLLDLGLKLAPQMDVFVLDTDFLFPQTYATITAVEARYGITVRRVKSKLSPQQQYVQLGERLWEREPDKCCDTRKVEPMSRALDGFDAWMTAIRRDQSSTRADAEAVSFDEGFGKWKICPLVRWTEDQVMAYVKEHDVPVNPLLFEGYTSIGCTHCTKKPTGDDPRSGRWAGLNKTECGLHARRKS